MVNYLVVLFKNKKKKRIINKFITYKKAEEFFNKKMNDSQNVIFGVNFEAGKKCNYELSIIQLSSKQENPVYKSDEFGRNVKIKLDEPEMNILKVSPYKKEEKIFDIEKNKKIDTNTFIKNYLRGDGVKMISILNNKLIVQDNEKVFLFTLKSGDEAVRFIESLSLHFYKIKRGDCLFVKDQSTPQKKYLYELLKTKGFDKKILYRRFTSLPH